MKIFALTNDNHMLDNLPDYYSQLYAGELDVKRWGHLSALYEVVKKEVSEDIIGVTVDGRLFEVQSDTKDMEKFVRHQLTEADIIVEPLNKFNTERVSAQFARCHLPSCLFYAYEAISSIYPQYEYEKVARVIGVYEIFEEQGVECKSNFYDFEINEEDYRNL